MKKLSLVFSFLFVTFCATAQVYYLLPNSLSWNSGDPDGGSYCNRAITAEQSLVDGTTDQLHWENGHQPERKAYEWFKEEYCANVQAYGFENQLKNVITYQDLIDGRLANGGDLYGQVRVLWLHCDWQMSETQFTKLVPQNVIDALVQYVKDGGNLYLSGFATLLAYKIGRASAAPDVIAWNCAPDVNSDTWGISCKAKGHAVYAALGEPIDHTDWWSYDMVSGVEHPDRNCLWNTDLADFKNTNDCQYLGCWANNANLEGAGFVEFFPKDDFKGTVITNGMAAYWWGERNASLSNVKNLTKGILDYLNSVANLQWKDDVPFSAVIGSQVSLTATANANYAVSYAAAAPEIANIGTGDGNVYANWFGNATFTAAAAGDGWNTPKNTTTISHTMNIHGGTPATVGYVLPYSLHTMSNYDNEEGFRPDFRTADWFYRTYVATGKGCFINPADLATVSDQVRVLWVHNDHVGLESEDYYTALGRETFRDALRAFLNKGNSVFLSKQATRLVGDLGRNAYPEYQNRALEDISAVWRVGNLFFEDDARLDRSSHPVYDGMGTNTAIQAQSRRTDNNDIWRNFSVDGTGNPARLIAYEADNQCRILAGWGHTTQLECVGMAEYLPTEDLQGTVIAMGLAAYWWGMTDGQAAAPTTEINNLYTLTDNILTYLQSPAQSTYTRTGLTGGKYGTICIPQAVSSTTGSGATFYSIEKANYENGRLQSIDLVEQTALVAGQPYIFLTDNDADAITLHIGYAAVSAPVAGNGLVGVFADTAIPEGAWMISNNQLYLCGTGNTARANRAYIQIESVADQSATTPAGARRRVICTTNTTTELNTATAEAGDIYDLLGRKVAEPGNGVYITGGKKMLVIR